MSWRNKKGNQPTVEDEDDDGFSGTKWVPPSQRAAANREQLLAGGGGASSQGFGDENPLRTGDMQELEHEALSQNRELTDSTLRLRKITEDTKGVAGQTLVTLKEQGDQLDRIHEKAVQMDQELDKGEKLLSKLGPLFSFGWKPKKGKKITGPKTRDAKESASGDSDSRDGLGLNNPKAGAFAPEGSEGMSALDRIEMERKFQESVLDDVSSGLDSLKNMAQSMGQEMERQDKSIDALGDDLGELNSRVKQSNQRAKRLLGKR